MKYWGEMTDKYGFGEGSNTPPDAYAARRVYATVVNRIAENLGSATRVLMYDRPGMHNGVMILFVWSDAELSLEKPLDAVSSAVLMIPDELFNEAVSQAEDLFLDSLVETTVTVDESSLEQTIKNLSQPACA